MAWEFTLSFELSSVLKEGGSPPRGEGSVDLNSLAQDARHHLISLLANANPLGSIAEHAPPGLLHGERGLPRVQECEEQQLRWQMRSLPLNAGQVVKYRTAACDLDQRLWLQGE